MPKLIGLLNQTRPFGSRPLLLSNTSFTHAQQRQACLRIGSSKRLLTWHLHARSGDDEPLDIDALAARLSAEAARLQSELGSVNFADEEEDDFLTGELADLPDPSSAPSSKSKDDDFIAPFGLETKAQEADVLASVGDGGFEASEFELLQELGQISIQQVEAPEEGSPFPTAADQRTARAAVIAYTASYFSGMPFQDPVVTLLKEYLPGAKAVACNELQILKHLSGMPEIDSKWKVASAPLSFKPPVVELLGYFLAGPSERALLADPSIQTLADADTIWIVQKWEGMAPLALYPSTQQTSGLGLGRLFGGNAASARDRTKMLRAITAGTLRALGFVHDRGVIHGSIGSGSVLLSTFSDSDWARLVVKLDNFGFARRVVLPRGGRGKNTATGSVDPLYPSPFPLPDASDDSPLSLGQRADKRQVVVVLLECILSALSTSEEKEFSSANSVQRVLGEVFEWDVDRYRAYVEDEQEWEAAAALLAGDGWELIQELVEGSAPASVLATESPFCQY